MADAPLSHLFRSNRFLTDPPLVVEFKGEQFGVQHLEGEMLRDALMWHFRDSGHKLVDWTRDHLEDPVALRFRDGRVHSFPYGRLWQRLAVTSPEPHLPQPADAHSH